MGKTTRMVKDSIKNMVIGTAGRLGISSKFAGAPHGIVHTEEWVNANGAGAFFKEIYPAKKVKEKPPLTFDQKVHALFSNEYEREQPQAFVANIPNGRVWGRNGTIITPDDQLLGDVSREFGKYGGCFDRELSVFKQIRLGKIKKINGKVAVAASAGSNNYHHWLYDTLPRLGLLKKAGLFPEIDFFILDYTGIKFQTDSLSKLGVDLQKVIPCHDAWKFHIQADRLFVTSLPAKLGTVNDWTVQFLREVFLDKDADSNKIIKRIYLSRKQAPSRKLVNESELISFLQNKGFQPFFAENQSISETAAAFKNCESVIGIHGSGFANLAFCSKGAKVIDLLPPKHLDPYYWIISNKVDAEYSYFFGEGERLPEETDLVKTKIDEDITINIAALDGFMNKFGIS